MKHKGASLEQSVGAEPTNKKPEIQDYETEGHLRTLMEAHGIMGDHEKMKKVHALAGRQHKALAGIKKVSVTGTNDLRSLYNKKFGAGAKDDELEEGGE